ncbi:MAG: hypothetical protein Q4F17_02275 [Eubacteriales bacterium]|nr:hypothetical protein [Eubacteriales bacterium]
MDWVTWKQQGVKSLQRYKYLALILLLGIFLMVLPEKQQSQPAAPPAPASESSLQAELTKLLSRVEGAGKVEVLLTEAAGARTVYQTNQDSSHSDSTEDLRRDTVLVTGSGREETGLVQQTIPPTYLGAVVLCQGADNARVRLSMVEAVMSATGLSSDNITVLKMK